MSTPPVVTLHVWGVPLGHVPLAVLRMATDRAPLRRAPGLRFAKLLGTGSGRTFTPGDADPRHWAVLACWDGSADAAAFDRSPLARRWDAAADERLRVELMPVASRGRWSGREPFGEARSAVGATTAGPTPAAGPTTADPTAAGPTTAGPAPAAARAARRPAGPAAAITRARLVPRRAVRFWRATPPVVSDLRAAPGLLLSFGIGEAPVGLQGTFSVWESAAALRGFAYGGAAHVEAIRRTGREQWYAEELFARFAVTAVDGTYRGRALPVLD